MTMVFTFSLTLQNKIARGQPTVPGVSAALPAMADFIFVSGELKDRPGEGELGALEETGRGSRVTNSRVDL